MTYIGTIGKVIAATAQHFGIPEELIRSTRHRRRPVANARHVAMYLSCRDNLVSKAHIGRQFGMTYQAVNYSCAKVEDLLQEGKIGKDIAAIEGLLNTRGAD